MKNRDKFLASVILVFLFFILIFVTGQESVWAEGTTLPNPLRIDDPRVLLGRIISGVLGIVGSLALASFVIGGFMWMLSAGNPTIVKRGTSIMIWSALGLAVIFFAYSLVRFLFSVVGVSE